MEGEEEWEGEGCGSLKTRPRKGKIGNPGAEGSAVKQEEVGVGESERCVYLDRDEGIEYPDETTGTKFSSIGSFTGEKKLGNDQADFETKNLEKQNGLPIVINNRSPKLMKAEGQSSSPLTFSEGQCENGSAKFEPVEDGRSANENGKLVDVSTVVVDVDVERVLEEQETHDLYCPNCNSCITKRVVLRKRKRIVPDIQVDAKREKIQPLPQPDLEASSDAAAANGPSHEAGPDVFRCLSCFSFFIPTASGFKLFPIFGRNNEGESLQSPRQVPARNLNCINSIFELFMGQRPGNKPGKDIIQSDKEEIVQPSVPSQHLDESEALLPLTTGTTSSVKGVNLPDKLSYVVEHIEDATRNTCQDKQSSLVLLMPESLLFQVTQIGNGEKQRGTVEQNNAGSETMQNRTISTDPNDHLQEKLDISGGKQMGGSESKPFEDENTDLISSKPKDLMTGERNFDFGEIFEDMPNTNVAGSDTMPNRTISTDPNSHLHEKPCIGGGKQMGGSESKPFEDENTDLISSKPKDLLTGERKFDFGEILEDVPNTIVAVDNMIQPVEGTVEPVTLVPSQNMEKVPDPAAPCVLPETRVDMGQPTVIEAKNREWDILKSIVYGGLIESITSLGVVSSASGSDATTLNIVALGLANLIGGLFVILHSLIEVKNDQHSSIDQGGEVDRYQETLGRRGHFRLHATVAVLSYMLFGLLPPIIYGFSFRKSDNKEYKLIAVAAASLLCITLLAIGQAHVRKAPKNYIKTVLYYVSCGVMASGLSYVVGVLVKKLLEKLGWFDSSAAAPVSSNLAFLETVAMKSGWASY